MDQSALYSKTAKGIAELGARHLDLPRGHYRLLSQVDGKSGVVQLADRCGLGLVAAEQICERLLSEGLVHVVSSAADQDWALYPNGSAISVEELEPEEGVRAWAEARRGVSALQSHGYFASTMRPMKGDARPSILSVEDDPLIARLLGVLLSRAGYEFRHAADGAAAFAAMEEKAPDLVLLDVMLPDTTGFAILEWIRKHAKLGNLPVVMVTAQVGEEDVMHGLKAGADGYIFKPFRPEPLLGCIRSILGI